jgi:hypothetical protein
LPVVDGDIGAHPKKLRMTVEHGLRTCLLDEPNGKPSGGRVSPARNGCTMTARIRLVENISVLSVYSMVNFPA